jgi:anti-sigma factor RsiW
MSDFPTDDGQLPGELVAYLDGEVDDDARRRIEQRLATDKQYRDRLKQYEQAWRMLDELPPPTAAPTFSKTTLEMVAVATDRPAFGAHQIWNTAGWLCASLAVFQIFGSAGYQIVESRQKTQLRQLANSTVLDLFFVYVQWS